MILELICVAVLGIGFVKEKVEQNKPYYGTERDIFRNNPRVQENRKAVDEITARCRREYIEKHGHDW